jgi:secondary thiamine-phosphate synthase enzyme
VTTLELRTRSRQEILDITGELQAAVTASGLRAGLCHVFVPHTTAGVTVNENADPDVKRDLLHALDRLSPEDPAYRHAEGNSPAHLKSLLTGSAVTLLIADGRLELGTWGGVYFCEFDGPRARRVLLSVQGEDAEGA